MKKYKMIQIDEVAHSKLKEYCEANDKKMGPVISRWINEKTQRNVLRVKN